MSEAKKNIKTVALMIIITFTGKFLGMYRDVLFGRMYGTTEAADAFMSASRIPRLFFDAVFAAAISSTFIPVFNEYLQKKDKKYANDFFNNFLNIVMLLTALLTFIGALFSNQIISFSTPGLSSEIFPLTVKLIRIMFPMVFLTGVAFAFVGYLQSFDKFNIPAAISIVANAAIIFYLYFFNTRYGLTGMAFAMLIGWALQIVIQIPSLKNLSYRYKFTLNFSHPGIKKVAKLTVPILISAWVMPINSFVNIKIASSLGKGAIAALDYANNLYLIVVGVFALAVGNIIFPRLSKESANKDMASFTNTLTMALKSVVIFVLPLGIGFMIVRVPLLKLIYEGGAFNASSTQMTEIALFYYSFGMLPYAMQVILNRAFYSVMDSTAPLITSAVSIVANIFLSIFLSKSMGIAGLALASSLSASVMVILQFAFLSKRLKEFQLKSLFKITLTASFGTILMGAAAYFTLNAIQSYGTFLEKSISLFTPALVGLIVYGAIALFLMRDEVNLKKGAV